MISRIEQLEQFAADDPNDPFNLYALALEYQKFDIPRALSTFKKITEIHPQYVATYYQFGKLYQQSGQPELAKDVFRHGLAVAFKNGDHKTHRELQSALKELDDE